MKKAWLDVGKLVTHPAQLKASSIVSWTPEATQNEAVLYNGQHRMEANILRMKDILKIQKAMEDKYHQEDHTESQLEDIHTKLEELTTGLKTEKFWGVQLFDLGNKFTMCF